MYLFPSFSTLIQIFLAFLVNEAQYNSNVHNSFIKVPLADSDIFRAELQMLQSMCPLIHEDTS